MLFGSVILATALLLSLTAEYYSIMGLTAIFAAAVIPVIVMGAALGIGKIVATVWLHNNWKRVPWTYKTYLVPAIAFLMFLTSMGIFGYLSKAHLEQATQTGDSQAQVSLIDEKIKTQKDNIDAARLALKQMDATVDQTISRSTDVGSVQIASALRKRQAKERADLQNEIGNAQTAIAKLQEQRAPLAAESRKIEAEVGPIKYIAALIYGDNPDANLLERAVRWVIILIVLVFDPLALCLILAANLQFDWYRHGKGGFVHDDDEKPKEDIAPLFNGEMAGLPEVPEERIPVMPPIAAPITTWTTTTTYAEPEPVPGEEEDDTVEEIFEMPSEWDTKRHAFEEEQPKTGTLTNPEVSKAALEAVFKDRPAYFATKEEVESVSPDEVLEDLPEPTDAPTDAPTEKPKKVRKPRVKKVKATEAPTEEPTPAPTVDHIPDLLRITDYETEEPKMVEVATAVIDPNTRIKSFKHEWEPAPLVADNDPVPHDVKSDFGTSFPSNAKKGDMYLRVDYLPTKLFKYNGIKWMEVDKASTDSYAFNEEYIKYVIERIDSGEYSLDDLTQTEQDQIAEYLSKNE